MPILDIDGKYVTKEEFKEQRVFRNKEEMQTSTLFNKEHPLDHIIRYPAGNKWEVTYYLQIRDVNDTVNLPDVNLPATVQKYNRINKLILYLQSAISQDNIENIGGEALINAGFLPNVHDAFMATLPGGREAVFTITEVDVKTHNIHYAYNVTFKLFFFVDTDEKVYTDIVRKTMKEYTYDKEHLLDYSAPIILSSDYKKKLSLKDTIPEIVDHYCMHFINKNVNVIALPTERSVYTDTLLNDFIFKIINRDEHDSLHKLSNIAIDLKDIIPYSIWDIVIKRDKNLLKRCVKDIGFKFFPFKKTHIINRQMNYLNVNFIATRIGEHERILGPEVKDISLEKLDDFHPPINFNFKSYVVSEAFYSDSRRDMFLLEELLMDYLEGKIIDNERLSILINEYPYWDTIDQYYLLPLLIVLIKDSINNTFKSL